MKYIVDSKKSVPEAVAALEEAVQRHRFGILHTYDLKETLENKGVELDNECHILEICNPHKAKSVLDYDMSMNMALPCRISVYSENGKTRFGMISPKALLASMSDVKELMSIAEEVEATTLQMIEEAK